MIHPQALIDPGAEIDENVSVGPFSMIGPGVSIASGSVVGPHVVIKGPTSIGHDNHIFPFSVLGEDPQDRRFSGEPTQLIIGDRNTIRESVTISRGTAQGIGKTSIGNDNFIMAYVHIAHDCRIGNEITFANAASLAGHVEVQDGSTLGGFTLVHQFCRIGAHAFTSMGSVLNRDLPPFCLASGNYARLIGVNAIGLRRKGFSEEQITAVRRTFVRVLRGYASRETRLEQMRSNQSIPEVKAMLDFIESSQRGILSVGRR